MMQTKKFAIFGMQTIIAYHPILTILYQNLEIIPNFSSKINIDIPEKIFPIEEKSTDISNNTNNPQVFSYNEIEGLLNDESFNIYINKIKESKNNN